MIKFIRINPFRTISKFKHKPVYAFSKQPQNSVENQNSNYIKSRQPVVFLIVIKIKPLQPKEQQNTMPDTIIKDKTVMWGLLVANVCFSAVIYFYPLANIGIATLNSGFIMSQLGQEFKKYLIVVNNNYLEQLNSYRSSQSYAKIILQNMLILSAQSLFLATNEFYLTHILTIFWYWVSIHKKIIPNSYYSVIVPILLAIAVNLLKKDNENSTKQQEKLSQKNN